MQDNSSILVLILWTEFLYDTIQRVNFDKAQTAEKFDVCQVTLKNTCNNEK